MFLFYNNLMEKNKKYDPSEIRGISIYHDGKRTVYAPFYSKKGYIMTESNTKHYINYMIGYIAAVVALEFAVIFTKNTPLSIGIALLVLIINFVSFYFNFLRKAAVIENYPRNKKDNFIIRQAKELEYDRIYTLIVCCILLIVIFYFYALWQKLEGIYLYIVVFIAVASVIYLIINIAILICKRNMDGK